MASALPASAEPFSESRFSQPINHDLLETRILPKVMKPARYLGIEEGAYGKSFERAKVRMALAFPDVYEIGFSNYALKLFYSLLNQQDGVMCDRVYAPDLDMKALLAEQQMPLFGVESKMPLAAFDILAFSLQYELNYTTVLGTLESAMIPFRSVERLPTASGLSYPLLIAGGPGSANPMPLAPFFDAFINGDGEEVFLEIIDCVQAMKQTARQLKQTPEEARKALLLALAEIEGLYVPGISEKAYKRIVDIAEHPVDLAPLIPAVEAVHDRVVIETRRGCDRMCRFCQPCFINLPVREQSIEQIKRSALHEIEKTGYEECSLLSLSIADYSHFKPLILEVAEALQEKNVSLSLPSQRADRFNLDVAEAVQSIRKSTLTFAPEAGTPRLRDVINKNLTDEEIVHAVTTAYQAGWNKVKLYFMIGLPTETAADLDGIVLLVKRLQQLCASIKRDPERTIKKHLEINITLSNFVPKPHTPFQWFPQDTMAGLKEKITYLKNQFRGVRGVKLNFTDPELSKLEAVISRGGPELADVLERAYQKGAYLDAWGDVACFQKWFEALNEFGLDPETYTRERCIDPDLPLPWDVMDVGLDKQWLKTEFQKSQQAASTTPCFETCSTCGVCATYSTWPKFIETPASDAKRLKVLSAEERGLKQLPVARVRLKIEKRGPMRFISHLDWLRKVHRAVMRARIPVAYSQGFNPSPNISFGSALPLLMESWGEYIDLELRQSLPVSQIQEQLNRFLPQGGKVLAGCVVPLYGGPSIENSIQQVTYRAKRIVIKDPETDLSEEASKTSSEQTTCKNFENEYTISDRVQFLVGQPTLITEVNTKTSRLKKIPKVLDLAPYIADIRVCPEHGSNGVSATEIIEFTIRRYQPPREHIRVTPHQVPDAQSFPTETHDQSEYTPSESRQSLQSESQFKEQPALIKPDWLLKLIDPNCAWSVTRTAVTLNEGQFPVE